MHRRLFLRLFLGSAAAAAGTSLAGCTYPGPLYGAGQYLYPRGDEYIYYPANDVYYSVASDHYYFPYRGEWRRARWLPGHIRLDPRKRRRVHGHAPWKRDGRTGERRARRGPEDDGLSREERQRREALVERERRRRALDEKPENARRLSEERERFRRVRASVENPQAPSQAGSQPRARRAEDGEPPVFGPPDSPAWEPPAVGEGGR